MAAKKPLRLIQQKSPTVREILRELMARMTYYGKAINELQSVVSEMRRQQPTPRPLITPDQWGKRVSYCPNGRSQWDGIIIPKPTNGRSHGNNTLPLIWVLRDHDMAVRGCYARNLDPKETR